jgi:hypothetical protein
MGKLEIRATREKWVHPRPLGFLQAVPSWFDTGLVDQRPECGEVSVSRGAETVSGDDLVRGIHRDLSVITRDEPALARDDPAVAIGEVALRLVRRPIGWAVLARAPLWHALRWARAIRIKLVRVALCLGMQLRLRLADAFKATLLVRHPFRHLVAPTLAAVLAVLRLVGRLAFTSAASFGSSVTIRW